MIEDALKATRNTHRILMLVSAITLVFALSIDAPTDKKQQLDLLQRLLTTDFTAYDEFVDSAVAQYSAPVFGPIAEAINRRLEADSLIIFQLHHLGEAFAQSPYVGKILIDKLVLAEISDAQLNQFETLNILGLTRDVQLVIPDSSQLSEEFSAFLRETEPVGSRVDNISLELIDADSIAESFLIDSTSLMSVYFELPSNIRTAGSPVFNADFPVRVVEVPNTSFFDWLAGAGIDEEIAQVVDDSLLWFPGLRRPSTGFMEMKLGLLADELDREIRSLSPDEKSVPVLGINIPGILFVYTSPLILLALLYYLFAHCAHLRRRVSPNLSEFRQFSWPPLTSRALWRVDFWGSMLVLPVLSQIVLFVQLLQFGGVGLLPTAVLFASVLAMLLIGIRLHRSIAGIREVMRDSA